MTSIAKVAMCAVLAALSAPAFAQEGNTPRAAGRSETAAAVDKAGAYVFNADRSVADVDPGDGKAMQAFVIGLSSNARGDLDSRCGVIIANPSTMGGPAGPFCQSLKTAELTLPTTPR